MLNRLNLILKSNQGLAFFRQNQILQSTRYKNLQQHNNEDFFIQFLKGRVILFTQNKFSTPTSVKEIFDQPLFLNPHTKIDFTSDNPYFYCISPKNVSDKFTTIRNICRFLQPEFISSTSFDEKLRLPHTNHNRIYYKFILDLIPRNWLHTLRTKTSQDSLLKLVYYNSKDSRKTKNLQKLSNEEIYFTLQHNNEKYNKPFKFISWSNYIEENFLFNPEVWGKVFTNWFKKCFDGYIFSIWYKFIHFFLPLTPAMHKMGNAPNTLCLRCKERKEF